MMDEQSKKLLMKLDQSLDALNKHLDRNSMVMGVVVPDPNATGKPPLPAQDPTYDELTRAMNVLLQAAQKYYDGNRSGLFLDVAHESLKTAAFEYGRISRGHSPSSKEKAYSICLQCQGTGSVLSFNYEGKKQCARCGGKGVV